MKYGRHQLNKAGEDLLSDDPFVREEALQVVNDWRNTFLPVLRRFAQDIAALLQCEGVPVAFSAQRIKRMTSIVDKLRHNAEGGMKLGGLQDIGGARFVFDSVDDLEHARRVLDAYTSPAFEWIKTMNYVEEPKPSGYRSIHYIYRHHSDQPDYDGLKIELQIRTRLQHSWAMAVETASLISRTSLKANLQDNSHWRDFFRLVSAIFATQEALPVHPTFANYTHADYCRDYIRMDEEYRFIEQLKALRVTIHNGEALQGVQSGYCVLSIDLSTHRLYFKLFPDADEAVAAAKFVGVEQSLTPGQAAVMVSIEKIHEIREAYPSYFLDTSAFLEQIAAFHQSCLRPT